MASMIKSLPPWIGCPNRAYTHPITSPASGKQYTSHSLWMRVAVATSNSHRNNADALPAITPTNTPTTVSRNRRRICA